MTTRSELTSDPRDDLAGADDHGGPEPAPGPSDADPEHERRPGPRHPAGPGETDLAVEVTNTQNHLPFDPAALADAARRTLALAGVSRCEVSVAVVDDATIHRVNREHLAHDWPTDVITFDLSEPGDGLVQGDLVVSAEMAATTAREAGVPAWDELVLYVVHGLLHLCGHDDTTPEARRAMRRREGEVLAALGLSNTFAAVDAAGEPGEVEP